MNKLTSKIITLILSIIMVLSMSVPTFAAEKIKVMSYADFLKGQEEGYIGYDVTYDDMVQLAKDSELFLEALENSGDFYLKYDSMSVKASGAIPSLARGDVVITNGTSSFGLTGHAGIAVDSNNIFSIDGKEKEGKACVPERKTRYNFYKDYKKNSSCWIRVYSPTKAKWGTAAAEWAIDTYEGSNAKYQINTDINDTSKTYCSKIVFQAYKFGAGRSAFNTYPHGTNHQPGNDYDYDSFIISPYALANSLKISERAEV